MSSGEDLLTEAPGSIMPSSKAFISIKYISSCQRLIKVGLDECIVAGIGVGSIVIEAPHIRPRVTAFGAPSNNGWASRCPFLFVEDSLRQAEKAKLAGA